VPINPLGGIAFGKNPPTKSILPISNGQADPMFKTAREGFFPIEENKSADH